MENQEEKQKMDVLAVPGPAIVISKEAYEKMMADKSESRSVNIQEKYKKFFESVNNETKKTEGEERSL